MSSEKDEERAKGQAKAQLESVQNMVARLKHCQECSGDEDCELSDEEICNGLGLWYQEGETEVSDENREEYHDEDAAREAITEDALSAEVRSDWHTPGDDGAGNTEYRICLCTGCPDNRRSE